MARVHAADDERRVHVHVVAGEVERDEALEEDGPARERRRQEDEQARRRAAVRHHVEDGAEARRLLKVARGVAVQRVEELRHGVEERAGAWVEGHVVERCDGEDDARVACGGCQRDAGTLAKLATMCWEGVPIMLGQKRKMFSWSAASGAAGAGALPLPFARTACESSSDGDARRAACAACLLVWRLVIVQGECLRRCGVKQRRAAFRGGVAFGMRARWSWYRWNASGRAELKCGRGRSRSVSCSTGCFCFVGEKVVSPPVRLSCSQPRREFVSSPKKLRGAGKNKQVKLGRRVWRQGA